jgi:small-conductance mechanosensitive channel
VTHIRFQEATVIGLWTAAARLGIHLTIGRRLTAIETTTTALMVTGTGFTAWAYKQHEGIEVISAWWCIATISGATLLSAAWIERQLAADRRRASRAGDVFALDIRRREEYPHQPK